MRYGGQACRTVTGLSPSVPHNEGMRKTLFLILALSASGPALAQSGVPPLPLAGEAAHIDVGISSLIAIGPAFRWTTAEPRPTGGAGPDVTLAAGGFLEYALDAFRFGGSLTGDGDIGRVELSAGYAAGDTTIQVRLGSEWGATSFGPQPGGPDSGDAGSPNDFDFGFTVRHLLTPNVYVAGTAAATAPSEHPAEPDRSGGFLFGATIGLKF